MKKKYIKTLSIALTVVFSLTALLIPAQANAASVTADTINSYEIYAGQAYQFLLDRDNELLNPNNLNLGKVFWTSSSDKNFYHGYYNYLEGYKDTNYIVLEYELLDNHLIPQRYSCIVTVGTSRSDAYDQLVNADGTLTNIVNDKGWKSDHIPATQYLNSSNIAAYAPSFAANAFYEGRSGYHGIFIH